MKTTSADSEMSFSRSVDQNRRRTTIDSQGQGMVTQGSSSQVVLSLVSSRTLRFPLDFE